MPNKNPDNAELGHLIAKLKDNPIHTISLASRELFHSNFIARLIEKYPDHFEKKMKQIFTEELEGESFDGQNPVDREKLNKDLTINLEGSEKKIIIENKVKSVPDKEQLQRYSKDRLNCYVLLSFVRWDFEIEKWFFMDYEYFLKNFLNFQTKKDRLEKYIEDYKEFLKDLIKLSKDYFRVGPNIDFFSHQRTYEKLREIKMSSIYHNVIYIKLKEKFKERINQGNLTELLDEIEIWEIGGKDKKEPKQFKNPKDKIETWTWFGSRNPTALFAGGIRLVYPVRKEEDRNLALYFEFQDNELKLCLKISRHKWIDEMGNDKALLDNYFEFLRRIKKKYSLESKIYLTPRQKNAIDYDIKKFDNMYYRSIRLNESMTVSQLMDIVYEAIRHIIESKDLQKRMLEIYEKSLGGKDRTAI